MMKKLFALMSAFFCLASVWAGEGKVILDLAGPFKQKGVPTSVWSTWRTKVVPAKPNTWYRVRADIKCMMTGTPQGMLRFRVRQVKQRPAGGGDDSIVFANIRVLKPAVLAYAPYSGVFMTKPNCIGLQVYFILNKIEGSAEFKNIKLEEVAKEEAEKIMAAMRVEPAFFSAPAYAYAGEKFLPWGYRVSKAFVDPAKLPAKISFEVPALKLKAEVKAAMDKHFNTKAWFKAPLKAGKYDVIMKAFDAKGVCVLEQKSVLRVINKPDYGKRLPVKSVTIDADGNTVINGKKTFLNGVYHAYTAKEAKEISYQGFNIVEAWMPNPASYKKALDDFASADLYSNAVLKFISGDKLRNLMAAIKDHPSVVSWDIVDEPSIRGITPDKLMPCVNEMRSFKTGKPFRISFSDVNAVPKYLNTFDIAATHEYVIPFAGLARLGEVTRTIVGYFPAPRKHSPQITTQSWIHWHDETRRPQTVEQTRSMAYLPIVNGAKGLFWYSFQDRGSWDSRSVPHLWSTFKGLNAQIFELENVILGKRTVVKCVPATVEAAVFSNGKRTVLIAVNTAKAAANVSVSAIPGKNMTELYADGAKVAVKGGKAAFAIPAETTRLFEVK